MREVKRRSRLKGSHEAETPRRGAWVLEVGAGTGWQYVLPDGTVLQESAEPPPPPSVTASSLSPAELAELRDRKSPIGCCTTWVYDNEGRVVECREGDPGSTPNEEERSNSQKLLQERKG